MSEDAGSPLSPQVWAPIGFLPAGEAGAGPRSMQLNAVCGDCLVGMLSVSSEGLVAFANRTILNMTGLLAADILSLPLARFTSLMLERAEAPLGLNEQFLRWGEVPRGAAQASQVIDGTVRLTLKPPRNTVIEFSRANIPGGGRQYRIYARDVTHEVEVDRMKSEFLSHAAHELRTPMASIFGFTELLMNQEFDEATRKDLLETIHRQTAWLVDIINELLDLARIEARRGKDFKIEAVEVGALVAEVLAAQSIDLERWPLMVDLPEGLPAVRADAAKLRQALTNVLGNAVKYSPAGGAIAVCADARTDARGQKQVGITVADNGLGMTPEQLGRVCERFYRADTTGNIPGTGLGMAIVKEIVELLGGHLEIASTPGQGTSVTLWLQVMNYEPIS